VSKKVTIEMDVRSAAAVRQVLFEAQKGYTSDIVCTPPRIFELREVIADLDDSISAILKD
jgi:hypothetical protein